MSVVRQLVPLTQPQWPGVDPFLFAVHHRDEYPQAKKGTMRPDADLSDRDLGMDFSGKDGWSMYHGKQEPGFPQHPHRGFETVTYVTEGYIDHTDSEGAQARYGQGDTQWLTAGSGIAHSEMFPLRNEDAPNPTELFQIWLNLAPEDKMADANFVMIWDEDTPTVTRTDAEGRTSTVRVVTGAYDDTAPGTPPPPASWAARADAEVAIWHITMEAGAELLLPPAQHPGVIRTLYSYGGEVHVEDTAAAQAAVVVDPALPTPLRAGEEQVKILVLQARPIGAPVVQQGPFVANSRDELVAAFEDYRAGVFGQWSHHSDGPVLPRETSRMARYPDGTLSLPPARIGRSGGCASGPTAGV